MTNLNKKRTLLASLIALGTIAAIPVVAQQAEAPKTPTTTKQPPALVPGFPVFPAAAVPPNGQLSNYIPVNYAQVGATPVYGQTIGAPMNWEEVQKIAERRQVLQAALAKWRSSDSSEAEKKEAKESIANYLNEEFERDQKHRKSQIQTLEEQVAKLRKQVEKRADAQSKIIELRMQLLENDSEGLAFPEGFNELHPAHMPVPSLPSGSMPGMISSGPGYPAAFPAPLAPVGSYGTPLPAVYPNNQPLTTPGFFVPPAKAPSPPARP